MTALVPASPTHCSLRLPRVARYGRVALAQRVAFPVVGKQQPPQIGMAVESHPEHVVDLPIQPVRARPDPAHRGHRDRSFARERDLELQELAAVRGTQQVDHAQGVTGVNGGDLGWLEPGELVAEFDSTVAALDSGEVSGIVKTQIGFHIIQLLGRDAERFHARHILAFLRLSEEDHKRAVDDLKSYRELALQGEDFSELALEYSNDPEVQQHKGNLGEWDLERLPEILSEFKPYIENLNEGEISEPFSTKFGYHIVKVNKLTENRSRTLETDYDYINEIVNNRKKTEYYQKWLADKKNDMYIEIKMTFSDTTKTIKKH